MFRHSGCVRASYPRQQQLRRLRHAAARALQAAASLLAAAKLANLGQPALASAALLLAALLSLDGSRALRRARRSRIGAESEALVRRALKPLERDGWRVRHALDWAGAGDLDHVVRAPSGAGFLIETKTLRYTPAHVARTMHAARWLSRHRQRYSLGVCPVICLARGRGIDRFEDGVRVVSLDRIAPALQREAAAWRHQPRQRWPDESCERLPEACVGVRSPVPETRASRPQQLPIRRPTARSFPRRKQAPR